MKSFFYYLCKRLAAVLPLLLVLPFMTFCLMHLMPGNYFDSLRLNPQISPETIKKYEALYHLDKPLLAQYFHWLENIVHLDFGYSFAYKQPVLKVLASRLCNTFLFWGCGPGCGVAHGLTAPFILLPTRAFRCRLFYFLFYSSRSGRIGAVFL